jgi:hypothetical protein
MTVVVVVVQSVSRFSVIVQSLQDCCLLQAIRWSDDASYGVEVAILVGRSNVDC